MCTLRAFVFAVRFARHRPSLAPARKQRSLRIPGRTPGLKYPINPGQQTASGSGISFLTLHCERRTKSFVMSENVGRIIEDREGTAKVGVCPNAPAADGDDRNASTQSRFDVVWGVTDHDCCACILTRFTQRGLNDIRVRF